MKETDNDRSTETTELRGSSAIRDLAFYEINGLEGDAYNDEIRSRVRRTLTTEFTDVETTPPGCAGGRRRRDREARARLPERFETPEARELRELTGRANAGAIIMAVTEKRNSIGAEAGASAGSRPGRESDPDRYVARRAAGGRRDHGTDERWNQPSGDRATCLRELAPARSWEFLARSWPKAMRFIPVLATRPDVGGPHSDSSDVPETDSTFDADLLPPDRVQASSMYRRVDAATIPRTWMRR